MGQINNDLNESFASSVMDNSSLLSICENSEFIHINLHHIST